MKKMIHSEISTKIRSASLSDLKSKARPISAIHIKRHPNEKITYNLFQTCTPPEEKSKTISQRSLINFDQLLKYCRPQPTLTTKSKQQLFQQIMQLKQSYNKLKDQYAIMKGKFEAKIEKQIPKNKQLERQFQKSIYWNGNKSHMISGIKRQYQVMQKDLKAKDKQNKDIKAAYYQSKVPELQAYIQELEYQNTRLKEKIQTIIVSENRIKQISMFSDKTLVQQHFELEENNDKLSSKLNHIKIQLQNTKQILKQKTQKIMFLEKLLIQKQNKKFHNKMSVHRLEKQIKNKKQQIINLQAKLKNKQIASQEKLHHITHETSKSILMFQKRLQNKEKLLQSLEDKNIHLQNLLTRNTLNKSNHGESMINRSKQITYHAYNTTINLHKSSIGFTPIPIQNDSYNKSAIKIRDQQLSSSIKVHNLDSGSKYHRQQVLEEDSEAQKFCEEIEIPRQRKTASMKPSENAIRLRKVQVQDIRQICQLIRYRLIALKITESDIKDLFSYISTANYNKVLQLSQSVFPRQNSIVSIKSQLKSQHQDQKWSNQYITMREVKIILQKQPLNLSKKSATLLSRYLIEDDYQQYVYEDMDNQQNRDIVKSIIKNIIGVYEFIQQPVYVSLVNIMKRYGKNLEEALLSQHPNNKVSSISLIKIVRSLGIQLSQKQQELILAKLSLQSDSLEALNYKFLF